jgi:uncharacterized protein involved in response to NO
LFGLAALWLAGRVAFLVHAPAWCVALLDWPFLPAVAAVIARNLIAASSRRNYWILVLLGALALANAITHLSALGVLAGEGRRALLVAVDVAVLMLLVMSARLVPMFTRGATHAEGIRSLPGLDRGAAVLAGAVALGDIVGLPLFVLSFLCAIASVFVVARARHWGLWASRSQPMLWILHVGHAWIALGFLMRAASLPFPSMTTAATHAFTAGALASLTLGMMTRVTLGHTGRVIAASRTTTVAFAAIVLAGAVRVSAPLYLAHYHALLSVAASCWTVAFALFLIEYGPMLLKPRIDGSEG